MCLTKRSFDIIDRIASNEGKTMKSLADLALEKLNYTSDDEKIKEYLNLRSKYLSFVYEDMAEIYIGNFNGCN